MLLQPSNEEKRVDSSLRENEEEAFYFTRSSKGFSWQSSKRIDEIASCLAMTAKAKHYHSHQMKKRELIRHCGKTPGRRSLLFYTKFKGVSWQSSKAH
jgi:hypothetical protein